MRAILGLMYTLALFVGVSSISYAAPSYTVTPLVIDEDVEARDIIEKTITLTNTGTQPVTIYPTVNNISVDEGGTIQEFMPAVMSDRTQSLASWIEISRAGINLMVGETKTVTLTLRIHPDPESGEYHAFIGFGHGGNRDEAEAQVKRGDAPGTVVSVTIADKKTVFLKLSRFFVDRFMTGFRDAPAVFKVVNPGDEVLTPEGEIIVYDSTGAEVGSVTLNPDGISVPPGEEHDFQAVLPSTGLFGKYKAYLDIEYGVRERASVQDTAFFYVIPFKIILPLLGIVLVLVVGVSLYVHKKYYDIDDDGAERIDLHVRDSTSESKHHDIDLTPASS